MAIFRTLIFIFSLSLANIGYAKSWIKFACYLLPQDSVVVNQEESIFLEIGQPEDGWPLEQLVLNSNKIDISSQVKQYQFSLDPNTYKVSSHLVWISKIKSEPNSKNEDYNRSLSVAKIETQIKTVDGIETREYSLGMLTTNVDAENPNSTKVRTTYKCLEPELL